MSLMDISRWSLIVLLHREVRLRYIDIHRGLYDVSQDGPLARARVLLLGDPLRGG